MFLKRKRCGKIKSQGCADGRKQREFISNEEASSPTVLTPALMATCLIDAIEGRTVATANISGVFLQSTMDDDVWIKFENDGGRSGGTRPRALQIMRVLSQWVKVHLYKGYQGDIWGYEPALLFYQLFSGQLADWRFKKNDMKRAP